MSDEYDTGIHTNPDARAWAQFYVETRDKYKASHPGEPYDTEDMMIGWFSNAMMAMHDHMRPECAPVVLPDGSAFCIA